MTNLLPPRDEKIVRWYLNQAPVPDITFSLQEVAGFLFGLAITPEPIDFLEWLPVIFDNNPPQDLPAKDEKEAIESLKSIFQGLRADFEHGNLLFPFDINNLTEEDIPAIYGWASGFEEALILKEETWDPEEHPTLSEKRKEELFFSMISIQGIVEPTDVINYFESLPDNIFQQTFPGIEEMHVSRESQIQLSLLVSLPLSVETLQKHSRFLLSKKRSRVKGSNIIKVDFTTNNRKNS